MSSAWDGLINDLSVTELPHYAENKSLPTDSYFTSKETASKILSVYTDILNGDGVDFDEYTYIEPSAGNGVFYDLLPKNKIGLDLIDRRDDLITADFLTWKPEDLSKKYLTIGNPPFGVRGATALAFVNRSLLFSDYVGFILPMSFHSNGKGTNMKRVKNGHLIFSEIYENEKFFSPDINKEIKINTLFQIWKRGVGKSVFKDYDITEYADIFTVCSSPDRLCGMDKIGIYDFYVTSSFYGENLEIVYNFEDVKYGSGYGIILKKDKDQIIEKISKINFRKYCSLSTNSCRHVRKHNIEECFYDLGFGRIVEPKSLERFVEK